MKNWLLGLCLVVPFSASPIYSQDDANQRDLEQLQGEWTAVIFGTKDDFKDVPPGLIKWTIKGNELENVMNKPPVARVTFKLDAESKPKTIDITTADGKQELGIYKLESDTLTICRALSGGERPKEFTMSAGVQTMIVLKHARRP